MEGSELLKLLKAVNELNIHSFKTVYQHESLTNLHNFYLEKICKESNKFIKFINLKTPLLELLLKHDDLKLSEIVIWDSLLKWGLAQNPSISQDTTKWSKEETTIMERTLHRYISLVKFNQIFSLKFYIAPNKKTIINIHPPRQISQQDNQKLIL